MSSSWLALVAAGAAAGVFAVAGTSLVGAVLGDGYLADVGEELGRLIALLSPWMVFSIGFSVTLPLLFVQGRTRGLLLVGLALVALHVPLAWLGQELGGLTGLALALAVTTLVALAVMLHRLHAATAALSALCAAALSVAALALAAFVLPALGLDAAPGRRGGARALRRRARRRGARAACGSRGATCGRLPSAGGGERPRALPASRRRAAAPRRRPGGAAAGTEAHLPLGGVGAGHERGLLVGELREPRGAEAHGVVDAPGVARAGVVDDGRDRRQIGVVEQHGAADPDVRGDVPPVEDRVGNPCAPSIRRESSGARLPAREHLVRRPDPELRELARVVEASQVGARGPDAPSSPGSGVTASWTAPRAANTSVLEPAPVSSVDQPALDGLLEPVERGPGEAPVLPVPVEPGWLGAEGVRDRRRRHRAFCARTASAASETPRTLPRRMPNPRALITGVGGQDGSLLAALLLDRATRSPASSGATRRPMPRRSRRSRAGSQLVEADLLDHGSLARALGETRPLEVYNLAAPSFVPRSWDEPIRTAEFAAVGATAMLEAIREVDPEIRFYQASSSEIFGEPRETPQTEETAPSPLTPYGVAKAYAHFIAGSYRKRYGMFTCCGILYNHESPLRPRRLPAAQGRARRRRDLARPRDGARARRPLARGGTGATPATTSARCGSCSSTTSPATTSSRRASRAPSRSS